MARIRSIKPELPHSESMGKVSRDARLLFIQLWTIADDSGRARGHSRMLASLLYPYDDDARDLISDWLDELESVGAVRRYQVDGESYLDIPNWLKHQKIDKPSASKYPAFVESSRIVASPRELSPPDQGREGIKEGIKERKGSTSASATPEHVDEPEWFSEFKAVYPPRAGDQGWRKALKAGQARITEGHLPIELTDGARRYAEFCRATQKIGTEFVKQAATFLGPDKPFLLPWHQPSTKADIRLAGNLTAAQEFMRRTEPQ